MSKRNQSQDSYYGGGIPQDNTSGQIDNEVDITLIPPDPPFGLPPNASDAPEDRVAHTFKGEEPKSEGGQVGPARRAKGGSGDSYGLY